MPKLKGKSSGCSCDHGWLAWEKGEEGPSPSNHHAVRAGAHQSCNSSGLAGAGMKLLTSLDHGQHSGHQLLLYDGVSRWTVSHLQDDLMGFPEEVLPHSCLHSPVPCSQPGTPFKDCAATTYRLCQEGNRTGEGALVANFAFLT